MRRIFSLVQRRTGRDFSHYKKSTITRRIERRMSFNQMESLGDYVTLLERSPEEIDLLVRDFLIRVTSFFRDPEAFDALKGHLEQLINAKTEGETLRVWVPGCSGGEEAYSLAMIIHGIMENQGKYRDWHVFATDLDQAAIEEARRGIYPDNIRQDVAPERLRKYFVRRDDRYQVSREIRDKLVFAVQDVITDPPFSRMDLISARNLLIYFDDELQKKVVPLFHYALNNGGLLFLGTAETVGAFTDLFTSIDKKWRIYLSVKTRP
jgi:two-component system CheB/CheR fusion protein